MPFIIWGSRGLTSTLQHGDFFCPSCQEQQAYTLQQVRPFFTLYFIPIFPIGGADRYVECKSCKTTFKEEVLNYEPPSEGQRAIQQLYAEMTSGTPIQVIRKKLENAGVESNKADELIEKLCDGQPRHCSCGQSFHSSVKKCTNCGAAL
jgi:hypothetical protein